MQKPLTEWDHNVSARMSRSVTGSSCAGSPLGSGVGSDAEVEDPAPVMGQYQQYVEHLETESGNREEAHRHLGFAALPALVALAFAARIAARSVGAGTVFC
jgi:hypothetical protein